MATGRVLVVHESGATRALLAELLDRLDLRVEAADSSFECMALFVDEAAELVVVGLGGLAPSELDLIRTLKKEAQPPRIVVTFPSPLRDLAVRALAAGADAYLLEPFYGEELLGIVRGQLRPGAAAPVRDRLVELAREVTHAVNNPLQVLRLLLEKDKVTKKELTDGIPPQLARVEKVIGFLREFCTITASAPVEQEIAPIVEQAAADAGIEAEIKAAPHAPVDERNLADALCSLFDAVALRCDKDVPLVARLTPDRTVRLAAPAAAFEEEGAAAMLDAVFVVRPARDVLPGLARVRALLEGMDASLAVERGEARVHFVVRLPVSPAG